MEEIKKEFLAMFNRVRAKYIGESHIRTMTETAVRNLKKATKSGYTLQEIEEATEVMFTPKDGNNWVYETGNTTPTHLLAERNLERYYNEAARRKSNPKIEVLKNKPKNQQELSREAAEKLAEESREAAEKEAKINAIMKYNRSLNNGEWLGDQYEAIILVRDFLKEHYKELIIQEWAKVDKNQSDYIMAGERLKIAKKIVTIAISEKKQLQ